MQTETKRTWLSHAFVFSRISFSCSSRLWVSAERLAAACASCSLASSWALAWVRATLRSAAAASRVCSSLISDCFSCRRGWQHKQAGRGKRVGRQLSAC